MNKDYTREGANPTLDFDAFQFFLTDDGMSYGMKYERLVPVLVNAIKELSARLDAAGL